MIILGIETSCDETAAAILQKQGNKIQILSNKVASSASMQTKYGGIIPEQAAREQIKSIIPVIKEAINDSGLMTNDIDAIAVTYGPGLIGSLLVGVETAKALSLIWNKPLIPVNHLLGHFYANWIDSSSPLERSNKNTPQVGSDLSSTKQSTWRSPTFPCLGLLVSGGHTDLVLFKNHNKYEYLGGTRDDAAGECFDKCARLLGLSYPGGPQISKLAQKGDPKKYKLPLPMTNSKDFDFSFSGLKTAVANIVKSSELRIQSKADLAASLEEAIIKHLINKTLKAAQKYNIEQIIVAGGVAANKSLGEQLKANFKGQVLIPPPYLCTDNAAMIASAAFFQKPIKASTLLQADPNLSLSS